MLVSFKKRLYPHQGENDVDTYTIALYDELDEKYKKKEVVTVVGYGLPQTKGLTYEFEGEWVVHKQYGRQLKLTSFKEVVPPTKTGIISYLSSGQITGIGPEMAERIYNQFGDQTLLMLDSNPEKLKEVKGVGEKKLIKIVDSYTKNRAARDVITFLSQYGISPKRALSLFKIYKANTMNVIRQDPYKLCENVGIGFKTADSIALSLGISKDDPGRVREALLYILSEAEKHGNMCLEREFLKKETLKLLNTELLNISQLSYMAADIVRWGIIKVFDKYAYRASTFIEEDKLAKCISKLLRRESLHINSSCIEKMIEEEENAQGFKLAPEQRMAVQVALSSGFSIITGGPGTGKTTIQKFLLNIYRRNNEDKLIECAAPTGKAARRMKQATGFDACTIHKLLDLCCVEGSFTEPRKLESKLLLIDEFSMCDTFLALQLLSSVDKECQIVLIGDADQLPSVGPGAVLRDLISCNMIPVVRLDRVYRQAAGSRIALNARLIRHGNCTLDYGPDFEFIDTQSIEESQRVLIDLFDREIAKYGLDEVVVLTPFRKKSITSVNELNPLIRERINPPSGIKPEIKYGGKTFREGDKVMMQKNCEFINNGDVGYITAIYPNGDEIDTVVTFDDGRVKVYSREELSDLELGYACTVHKSQGTEYQSCILNLQASQFQMLKRPLIYTAITRAKNKVIIVGERRALGMAVSIEDTKKRLTNLAPRIIKYMKENPNEIRGLQSGT